VKLRIRWHVFYNVLARQPLSERQTWLTYFRFGDSGVELIEDVVVLDPNNPADGTLSELERAVLSAIGEPKRPRFLQ
jgi:hypothetical protein